MYRRNIILILVLVSGAYASDNPFDIEKNIQKVEKEETLFLNAIKKEQTDAKEKNNLLPIKKNVDKPKTKTTTKPPLESQLPPEVKILQKIPTQKVNEETRESKIENVSLPEKATANSIIENENKSVESDISKEVNPSKEETKEPIVSQSDAEPNAEEIPMKVEVAPEKETEEKIKEEKSKEINTSETNASIASHTEEVLSQAKPKKTNNKAKNNYTKKRAKARRTTKSQSKNYNRKPNKNVNKNPRSNNHVDKYYGSFHGRTAVGFRAKLAVGSVVIASTMPNSCKTVVTNSIRYRRCGSSHYKPHYRGDTVVYQVVNSPY